MSNKDNLVLVLLYANWCGHCKNFYRKDSTGKPLDLEEAKKDANGQLTWQQVKKECGVKTMQFEEKELENADGKVENISLDELNKYMSSEDEIKRRGWPTIVMLKKNGDKYDILKQFEKSRSDIQEFKDFIKECEKECEKGAKTESGQKGGAINYRHKYKKYKVMYRELMQKYKQIGGK